MNGSGNGDGRRLRVTCFPLEEVGGVSQAPAARVGLAIVVPPGGIP